MRKERAARESMKGERRGVGGEGDGGGEGLGVD